MYKIVVLGAAVTLEELMINEAIRQSMLDTGINGIIATEGNVQNDDEVPLNEIGERRIMSMNEGSPTNQTDKET